MKKNNMPPAALRGICSALRRGDLTHEGQKHGGKGSIHWTAYCPHVFVTSHGARVASQQLPYPPDWRGGYYQCYKKYQVNNEKKLQNQQVIKERETGILIVVEGKKYLSLIIMGRCWPILAGSPCTATGMCL
jgi:hypothetical protein